MRLLLIFLAACGSSASVPPHELVPCDMKAWNQFYLGTLAANAQCEAACKEPAKMPGNACTVPPNDAGTSGICHPAVTDDGITGCCLLGDFTCSNDAGVTGLPCQIDFVECK